MAGSKPITTEQLKALAQAYKNPHIRAVLEDWQSRELSELPYALVNPALKQGRCQVLTELIKLMETALTHTD
jgi:hypothetical protein